MKRISLLLFLIVSFQLLAACADEAGIRKIIQEGQEPTASNSPTSGSASGEQQPIVSEKQSAPNNPTETNSQPAVSGQQPTPAQETQAMSELEANQAKINETKQGVSTMTTEEIKSETLKDSPAAGDTVVVIKTNKGPIKIKLFTKEAPKTSENFLDLVKKGFYNGTIFHRVVKGFVIQGGDPLGNGTGNYIDSQTGKARYIDLEINNNLKWDRPGRVGMARSRAPNSASCQFFISLNELPSLNPGGVDEYGYAVFGQVTEDTLETVKKIAEESKPAFPGSEKPSEPIKMELVTLL